MKRLCGKNSKDVGEALQRFGWIERECSQRKIYRGSNRGFIGAWYSRPCCYRYHIRYWRWVFAAYIFGITFALLYFCDKGKDFDQILFKKEMKELGFHFLPKNSIHSAGSLRCLMLESLNKLILLQRSRFEYVECKFKGIIWISVSNCYRIPFECCWIISQHLDHPLESHLPANPCPTLTIYKGSKTISDLTPSSFW